jgi:hypothetical protein
LDNGELNVPGARRKIEYEVIERSPSYLPEKLLRVSRYHRTAKHGGRGIVEQEAHGHELQSLAFDGKDAILIISHWPFVASEHQSDARAIEIAIAKTHPGACRRQRDSKIRGHRGLAHTPLSTRHGDDMLDTFQLRRTGEAGSLGRRLNIDLDFNTLNPCHPCKRRLHFSANLPGNCRFRRGQDKLNRDVFALNPDLLNQTERYDVSGKAGVFYSPEGVAKSLFIRRQHAASNMLANQETTSEVAR